MPSMDFKPPDIFERARDAWYDKTKKSLEALARQEGHPGCIDIASVLSMLELRR